MNNHARYYTEKKRMVEKTCLKSIAIFVCSLIIMLPVYSSYAMAVADGSLSVLDVYGSKGISGYAQNNNDAITFKVQAYVDEPDLKVTPSQIEIFGGTKGSGIPFGRCEADMDNRWDCYLEKYKFTGRNICDPSNRFKIYLYDDAGGLVDSNQNVELSCDTVAPTFTALDIQGSSILSPDNLMMFGESQDVILSYSVADTACLGCSGCVGFEKLVLSGGVSQNIPLGMSPGICTYPDAGSEQVSIPASSFNQGKVTIKARIYDNFDQYTEKTATFIVDKVKPTIDTFAIVEHGTSKAPEYVVSNIKVDLSARIRDADANVDTSSVTADLSSIGLGNAVAPNGGCTQNSDLSYACSWNNLNAGFTGGSYSIIISATDKVGNLQQNTFKNSIIVDTILPKFKSMSITCQDPRCQGKELKNVDFLRGNENILVVANFTDGETGIDSTRPVEALLSSLNPDYESFEAGSCTLINADLSCEWNLNLKLDGSESATKSISFDNVWDKANNENQNLKGLYTIMASRIDTEGPVVSKIVIVNRTESGGFFYLGSSQNKVQVTLKESGVGFNASRNVFINVGSSSFQTTGCKKSGDWVCDFSVPLSSDSTIKVASSTADDFGNRVQNPDEFVLTYKIDTTPPALAPGNSISIISGYPTKKDYFVKDYPITMRVNVTESSPGLRAIAHFSNELIVNGGKDVEGVCTLNTKSGWYNCVWDDTITSTETGDTTVTFEFIDLAGNTVTNADLSRTITIYEQREIPVEPFYNFSINTNDIAQIDKTVLKEYQGANYYQNFLYTLQDQKKCDSELEIIGLKMSGSCAQGVTVNKMKDISNPYDYSGMITFAVDRNWMQQTYLDPSYGDDFVPFGDDNCNLEVTVRCGTFVYTAPEEHNFHVNVPFMTPSAGDNGSNADTLSTKITTLEQQMLKTQALMNTLDVVMKVSNTICDLYSTFGFVQTVLSATGIATGACVDAGSAIPFLRAGCSVANTATSQTKGFLADTWNWLQPVLGTFCQFVTCTNTDTLSLFGLELNLGPKMVDSDSDNSDKHGGMSVCSILQASFLNSLTTAASTTPLYSASTAGGGGAADFIAGATDYFESTDTLQLSKDSFVYSLLCACIPGIYYNVQKFREIQCMKGVCLKYMVPMGVPQSKCEQESAYLTCNFVVGGVMLVIQRISGLNIVQGIIDKFADLLNNPAAWGLHAFKTWASNYCLTEQVTTCNPAPGVPGACTFTWTTKCVWYDIILLAESVAVGKRLIDTASAFPSLFQPTQGTYCQQFLKGVCTTDGECDSASGEKCKDGKCVAPAK